MSLSNFFFGDIEEDPIFGIHMRQMRQMTNMLSDPFAMMMPSMNMSLMPRMSMGSQFGLMPNFNGINRLTSGGSNGGVSYSSSSSMICMSNGANGQPQIYKETSSMHSANGVRETRRTVEDSSSGTRKMAIGHHVGEKARIVEKEQNVRTGQREEREELINLDDSETEEFEREFQQKASKPYQQRRHLQIEEIESVPAIQSSEDYNRNRVASHRRPLRASPLALPSSSSIRSNNESSLLHSHSSHPYNNSSPMSSSSRKQMKGNRKIKGHLNHH